MSDDIAATIAHWRAMDPPVTAACAFEALMKCSPRFAVSWADIDLIMRDLREELPASNISPFPRRAA